MSALGKMCWLVDVPIQPPKSRKEGHSSATDKTASYAPNLPSILIAKIIPRRTRRCPPSASTPRIPRVALIRTQLTGPNGNGMRNTNVMFGLVSFPEVRVSILTPRPISDQYIFRGVGVRIRPTTDCQRSRLAAYSIYPKRQRS